MKLLDRIRDRVALWLLRRRVTRITVSMTNLGATLDEVTAALRHFGEVAEPRLGQQVAAKSHLPRDLAQKADEIERERPA